MNIRLAQQKDIVAIIGLLADDPLGQQREQFTDPLPPPIIMPFKILLKILIKN